MRLPGLDVIFRPAATAIDVLIDGAAAHSVEAGDDEAGIDAQRPGLDTGDDALDAVPACSAIIEFLEAAQLLAAGAGGARRRAGFQPGDVLAQGGGWRDTQHVIEPLGAAEAEHFGCAIVAVGAQQDLDTWPVA